MGLDEDFEAGIKYVQNAPSGSTDSSSMSNQVKLRFYGLYKQATAGPCTTTAPSRLKLVERAKWQAWKDIGSSMTKQQAKEKYVAELDKLNSEWRKKVVSKL
jgi:acyl-CoA-binding protein